MPLVAQGTRLCKCTVSLQSRDSMSDTLVRPYYTRYHFNDQWYCSILISDCCVMCNRIGVKPTFAGGGAAPLSIYGKICALCFFIWRLMSPLSFPHNLGLIWWMWILILELRYYHEHGYTKLAWKFPTGVSHYQILTQFPVLFDISFPAIFQGDSSNPTVPLTVFDLLFFAAALTILPLLCFFASAAALQLCSSDSLFLNPRLAGRTVSTLARSVSCSWHSLRRGDRKQSSFVDFVCIWSPFDGIMKF